MSGFILGPLWQFSVLVFCVGVTWRIGSILLRSFPRELARPRGPGFPGGLLTLLRRSWPKNGLSRENALPMIAGYAFHLGLFVLLFFAEPHLRFLEFYLPIELWTPIPGWAFVIAAQIAFAGLLLLWLRRVMHPVTRLISTLDDHLASGLTFLAMFTGCLALFESSTGLRVLHVLAVELLLLYFPFSNLMHAFTLFISRSTTGAKAARHGVSA